MFTMTFLGPYTALYRLPNERLESYIRKKRIFYNIFKIGVLELKGFFSMLSFFRSISNFLNEFIHFSLPYYILFNKC